VSELQRRELHEALVDADTFEDLPGKWQAAILKAEQNRPKLRVIQQLIRPLSIGGARVALREATRGGGGWVVFPAQTVGEGDRTSAQGSGWLARAASSTTVSARMRPPAATLASRRS
jgi:hypothetical protein